MTKCCGTCKWWTAREDSTEFPFGRVGDCDWVQSPDQLPKSIAIRRLGMWSRTSDCPCWEEKECSQPS
jgi:hypothetical protein